MRTWTSLKSQTVNKRSQAQKMTCCLVSLKFYKRQSCSDRKQVLDCCGHGEGRDDKSIWSVNLCGVVGLFVSQLSLVVVWHVQLSELITYVSSDLQKSISNVHELSQGNGADRLGASASWGRRGSLEAGESLCIWSFYIFGFNPRESIKEKTITIP